eukprot:GHVS01077606.1.p1 GENE.GHVS01077606.1~~GHVS01077606.1.p1  ORF type:complete len:293 (-),score=58.51 GHVS01077606.1:405-1283(-)
MSSTATTTSPVLLRLQPEKYIEFPLSLYNTLKTKLVLQNISSPPSPVSFKIKTTAPKCYLVRPSTGVVSPGNTQEVEIVLQPLTQEPPPFGQDRFLVQAICVQEPQVALPRDYWTTVDKTLLQEQRLTVMFRKPEGGGDGVEGSQQSANGGGPTDSNNTGMSAVSSGQFNTAHSELTTTTQQQQASSGGVTTTGGSEYKTKYEEVVKYCLSLEKKNNIISKDNEELKKQLAIMSSEKIGGGGRDSSGSAIVGGGGGVGNAVGGASKFFGLEFWHWFLIVMIGVIFMKLSGKI